MKDGTIVAARLYMQQGESGTYNIRLWTPDGKLLAGPFSHNLSSDTDGWVTILLDEPISIAEGNEYILAINTNDDRQYARSQNVMLKTVTTDFFTLNKNAGLIGFNGAVPSYVYDSSNYFRDIGFIPDSKS